MTLDAPSEQINSWLKQKPGPFSARTAKDVWNSARTNFQSSFAEIDDVLFIMNVRRAGLDVRPTTIGGFVLDCVKESDDD